MLGIKHSVSVRKASPGGNLRLNLCSPGFRPVECPLLPLSSFLLFTSQPQPGYIGVGRMGKWKKKTPTEETTHPGPSRRVLDEVSQPWFFKTVFLSLADLWDLDWLPGSMTEIQNQTHWMLGVGICTKNAPWMTLIRGLWTKRELDGAVTPTVVMGFQNVDSVTRRSLYTCHVPHKVQCFQKLGGRGIPHSTSSHMEMFSEYFSTCKGLCCTLGWTADYVALFSTV